MLPGNAVAGQEDRTMSKANRENPDLVRQHVEKGRVGDRELQKKPGRPPPGSADARDRTPPRKGDPEQVENVPGREEHKSSRRPDHDETYRTGKTGPK